MVVFSPLFLCSFLPGIHKCGYSQIHLKSLRRRLSLKQDYVQSSPVPNTWANQMSVKIALVPELCLNNSCKPGECVVLFQDYTQGRHSDFKVYYMDLSDPEISEPCPARGHYRTSVCGRDEWRSFRVFFSRFVVVAFFSHRTRSNSPITMEYILPTFLIWAYVITFTERFWAYLWWFYHIWNDATPNA